MKKSFVLILMTSLLMTNPAYSTSRSSQAKTNPLDFYDVTVAFRRACQPACETPYNYKIFYKRTHPSKDEISPALLSRLNRIASDQAQIWGDTILEGDYFSDGRTQLDFVAALYKEERLIGYKITYSERAWYIGECHFDEEDEATLTSCAEGRIQESGFVSPDFKEFFRDEDNFADFR